MAHARQCGVGALAEQAGADMFRRGLLEWRLSVTAAAAALAQLPDDHAITIRYEDLLRAPAETIRQVEAFMAVEASPSLHRLAQDTLRSQSRPALLDEDAHRFIGEVLGQFGYTTL